ncbi:MULTISPECIES: hypothetical protein [Rahnella]|nr:MULTISPECIES: hypothetical protein [Rahnella]
MNNGIENKVILITGGNTGIGAEFLNGAGFWVRISVIFMERLA